MTQVSNKQISDDINKIVRNIILRTPHWGYMLSSVNRLLARELHKQPLPTACVYKEGLDINMAFNPDFMETLDEGEKMFVILHEMLHIAWVHPVLIHKYKHPEIFNIAADMEINQHVSKVKGAKWPLVKEGEHMGKSGAVTLERFGLNEKEHAFKGVKWYYDYLVENAEEVKIYLQGEGSEPMTGDHSHWSEDFGKLGKSERELLRGNVQRKIAQSLSGDEKAIGDLPGSLRDLILDILNPKPVYDFKKILKRLLTGYSTETYLKSTRRRPSIRFVDSPGNRLRYKKNILVAIDTSGSMCNDELVESFVEVDGMKKAGCSITVVECDAAINEEHGVYKYKNLEQLRKRKMITGGGGTSFDPPLQYYKDHPEYNLLIYFTDGEAPKPEIKPNKPIIWIEDGRPDT